MNLTDKRKKILQEIVAGNNRVTDLKNVLEGEITQAGIIKALENMEEAEYIEREPTGRGKEKTIKLKPLGRAALKGNNPEDLMNEVMQDIDFIKKSEYQKVLESYLTGVTPTEKTSLNSIILNKCEKKLLEKRILMRQGDEILISAFGHVILAHNKNIKLRNMVSNYLIGMMEGAAESMGLNPGDALLTEKIKDPIRGIADKGPEILFGLMGENTYKDLLKDDALFLDINSQLHTKITEILTACLMEGMSEIVMSMFPDFMD